MDEKRDVEKLKEKFKEIESRIKRHTWSHLNIDTLQEMCPDEYDKLTAIQQLEINNALIILRATFEEEARKVSVADMIEEPLDEVHIETIKARAEDLRRLEKFKEDMVRRMEKKEKENKAMEEELIPLRRKLDSMHARMEAIHTELEKR